MLGLRRGLAGLWKAPALPFSPDPVLMIMLAGLGRCDGALPENFCSFELEFVGSEGRSMLAAASTVSGDRISCH